MRLAQRLLLGSALVISVLVVLVVALSGQRLRRQLVELTAGQLRREATLIALDWRPGVNADSLADATGQALGHRVTLIDSTGRVAGDSEFDGEALARLEDHGGRPEVIAAMRDSLGIADRRSSSAGDVELYTAVRSPLGVARVSLGTAQVDAIVARARRDVLLSGLTALVAALVLAIAFSRAVSRPIVELRDVAQALAGGDLTRRPGLSAPGEVGDLATAVHRMAEQLDQRLRALQAEDLLMSAVIESLHEGIVAVDSRRQVIRLNESARRMLDLRMPVPFSIDLLPRDRAIREALEEALDGHDSEAELAMTHGTFALTAISLGTGGAVLALLDLTARRRLETMRRDFVANVSHELKTPLTVISGFAETLAIDDPPSEQRRQFAEAIRGNAARMHRLIDDLLDLSRIESGGWIPAPSVVEVRSLAAETLAQFEPEAARRGVTLSVHVDEAAPNAFADPTALRQILANLLGNALRHTPRDGAITVFTRREDAGVWVGVRDTGTGIAPEHLPRIFERFYRADPARSREAGGTGLGLSIVRHLVEAHRGRVHAESTVGRGTVVSAFFPESIPPARA
ncbi:MAG TPA: ATP-binding protein [Gemmatimonadaceae bacterium]|nr:ATP-binding protein [Gemmatimonadaceae bacterium]